jgi:hypothetical protein
MLKKTTLIVILVCLVSFTTFPSKGYCLVILVCLVSLTTLPENLNCDDWVFVESNQNLNVYYHQSSIKIDTQNKTIKVLVKRVYTENGKIDYLNKYDIIGQQKYADLNYTLTWFLLDYQKYNCKVTQRIYYSKSGNVLKNIEYQLEWVNLIPDFLNDFFFNKILQDYNIQR